MPFLLPRLQNSLNLALQLWQILLDGPPYQPVIHTDVKVDQPIPHSSHFLPGNLGKALPHPLRDLPGHLAVLSSA